MSPLQYLLQAFFTNMQSAHQSDVSETTSSTDDDYQDDTSISTTSSTRQQTEEGWNNIRESNKSEIMEATRSHVFGTTSSRLISTRSMGKSLPIACPSPSRDHARDKEFEEDMMYVYNEATWRMYHRIVDARKRQSLRKANAHKHMDNYTGPKYAPSSGKIKRASFVPYNKVPGMICSKSLPIISHYHGMNESLPCEISDEFQMFHMDD